LGTASCVALVWNSAKLLKEMSMRRVLLFGLVAVGTLASSPAWAQQEFRALALDEKAKLLGERKVRYLLRQIDLTPEQAAYAQDLLASMRPGEEANKAVSVDEVRQIWAELEEAKKANDQQKIDALTKRLQEIGQGASEDSDILSNLRSRLTDAQKQKLERAEARLEQDPSGALRPIDMIRVARSFELSDQQQQKLLEALLATNAMLGPILKPSMDLKLRMVTFLAGEIRALLTPDQVAEFNHRIRALRPDLIDEGLVDHVPTTQPVEAGESDSD
jgi:hypothetical protein